MDQLNEEEISKTSKAKFLDLSKRMEELLQKQEIYWAQWSRVSWLKHCDKIQKIFTPMLHREGGRMTSGVLKMIKGSGLRK